MAISKIQYKSSPSATPETWMDVTDDSVTAGTLLSGETATQANGVRTTGTYTAPVSDVQVGGTSVVTNTVASVPALTSIIDDTAGNGDTDKVWSADKVYDELYLKAYKYPGAVVDNYASFNGNGQPIDSGHSHSDYINVSSNYQTISSTSSYTALVLSSSTAGNTVDIRSDSEGGNIQVKKGNNLAEFDSQPLVDGGTGYARIFVKTGTNDAKEFKFKQSGDFEAANGISLSYLSGYKADQSSIAIRQSGLAADKNIDKGKFIYWGSSLYVAKAAIANGDTLSTSTNLTAISDGGFNLLSKAFIVEEYSYSYAGLADGGYKAVSASDLEISAKQGYTLAGFIGYASGSYNIYVYGVMPNTSGTVLSLRNKSGTSVSTTVTCRVVGLWIRNELL